MSQNLPHLPEPSGLSWRFFQWNQRRVKSMVHGPWGAARSVYRWAAIRGVIVFGCMFLEVLVVSNDSLEWLLLPLQLCVGGLAGAGIAAQVFRMRTYKDGYVDGLEEARGWIEDAPAEATGLIRGRVMSLQLGTIPGKGQ